MGFRNVRIPSAIIKNGFYEKEYHRQTFKLPYNENEYHNEKQLTREQIDALIHDTLDINAIVDALSYIINVGNRNYGYKQLFKRAQEIDRVVDLLTLMDIGTQADMSDTIEQLVKERPELQPYIKYEITKDADGRCTSISTLGIGRNGDFTGSFRVYLHINLPDDL
jgi:hypothetical protein